MKKTKSILVSILFSVAILSSAYAKNALVPSSSYYLLSATSIGKNNALKSAKNYLSFSAFSYSGLIKQLEFEKYSHEEAVYAVDNCGANWNEQAAKKAQSYLSFSSFSRDSLIRQLEFEGFTHEQAIYGVTSVGY